jgi:hypothetical protein
LWAAYYIDVALAIERSWWSAPVPWGGAETTSDHLLIHAKQNRKTYFFLYFFYRFILTINIINFPTEPPYM